MNSLRIRYYDEKNKKHTKEFYKITDNPIWSVKQFNYKKTMVRSKREKVDTLISRSDTFLYHTEIRWENYSEYRI